MFLTIVIPLSRRDRVERLGLLIGRLDTEGYEKKILIVCDDYLIPEGVIRVAFEQNGIPYDQLEILYTGNGPTYSHDMHNRRERITNIWKLIQKHLQNAEGLLLGIEDDGNFQPDDFKKLIGTRVASQDLCNKESKKLGIVSAVEAGRWGYKMIGAWEFLRESQNVVRTIPFNNFGIRRVDTMGLYFFVMDTQLLQQVELRHGFFGPDFYFGVDLSNKGYFNYIDYSIKIVHDNGIMPIYVDKECVSLTYQKVDEEQWEMIGHEPYK